MSVDLSEENMPSFIMDNDINKRTEFYDRQWIRKVYFIAKDTYTS